jgi:ABC-2 type transport system ATP-binding protein
VSNGRHAILEVNGLTCSHRGKVVLREVTFDVAEGEVCAVMGPNGAGKSTLLGAILGLVPVTSGSVTLFGMSNRSEGWKRRVAYLPEKFQLYPQLTAEENLRFFAGVRDGSAEEEKLREALRRVGLWEYRHKRVRTYSKGMLQRLGLAVILYDDADLLFLDEPTSGLDPDGRRETLSILGPLAGKTILFTSHHLDEVRQVCTHVLYVFAGRATKMAAADFFRHRTEGGGIS